MLNQGHQYYVYEPDMQIFLAAMHHIDFQSTFAGIPLKGLAVGADKNTIDQFFLSFSKVYERGNGDAFSICV
ncbi:hypothetical protein [Cohnella rhizosphaerae]|uniref:hypothetical protein n=1 Tax=Cohnella rhizosphaerae TaxID=1457232 RepID=UPI003B8A895F